MKRWIASLLFVLAVAAVSLFTAQKSHAYVYRDYSGYWVGNICRYGAYYQVVPFQVVNTSCYMPGWNAWGYISWE